MDTRDTAARKEKATAILDAQADLFRRIQWDEYHVPSQQENGGFYRVKLPRGTKRVHWQCNCKDFEFRHLDCKHILAVRLMLGTPDPEPAPEPPVAVVVERKPRPTTVSCKHCAGDEVTRYGRSGKRQAYWCKPCERKFTPDRGFKRLRADAKVVTLALDLYFKGVSLRSITDTLSQFFDVDVSHVTVYNWLKRYTRVLTDYAATLQPHVGTARWQADEMKVKFSGEWRWLWHVMDKDTRFLLVSTVTDGRDVGDALTVFRTAKTATGGMEPRIIVTDGLPAYQSAAKRVFNAGSKRDNRHLREIHLTDHANNNNGVERLNGTVRARQRAARGLKSEEGPINAGHPAYYNLLRPHMGLDGRTPAEAAGLSVPTKGNRWLALIEDATEAGAT